MIPRLKYTFSFILFLSPFLAFAQDVDSLAIPSDTVEVAAPDEVVPEMKPVQSEEEDTVVVKSSLNLALDYGKIVTLPSNFETKVEVTISYTLKKRLEIISEIGYANLTPDDAIKNGSYESEGVYYRAGLAYGGEIVPKSFLRIGAMYGTSNFEDGGVIIIRSEVWDDLVDNFRRENLSAQWFEIILITEQEIKNNLFLGSKFRLRKLINFQNDYIPEVYSIPGYGRTFDSTIPAFNLYIKYAFFL